DFFYGSWPVIYPQVRLAVFAVIAFATSVVDVAAILGPSRPETLALRLVQWMHDPDLSMRFPASAGALLQFGVSAAAILVWIGLERLAASLRDRGASGGVRFRRERWVRGIGIAFMATSALAVFAGLATLAVWSVAGLWPFPDAFPQRFTLAGWTAALPRIAAPLATTFVVAALSTLIATLLAVLCLIREDRAGRAGRLALFLVYLPLIVPQVAFLFGVQFLFLLGGVMASLPALMLVHLVFVVPYVFLSLSDPWRAFDRRYEAAAHGLGRSR